jgi:uncharacterized phage infection (PIP) family protein YhgE
MDQNLYRQLQGIDIGSRSDDYFRGLGFSRGRQDAIDFMARMRDQDPAVIAQRQIDQRNQLNARQREEENSLLTRFREQYPQTLQNIEQQLGLPSVRENVYNLGETIRDIPAAVKQATQGTGITAAQLAQKQLGRQNEYLPEYNEMARLAQYKEEEFNRQADRALMPWSLEIDQTKDRLAREFSGFNIDNENQLNTLLQKMQLEGQLSIAEMNNATQLAQLEQSKFEFQNAVSSVDAGDRIVLLDASGREVGSVAKGLTPSQSGSGGENDDFLQYFGPQETPTTGIGTMQGNWYYSEKGWMPVK